MWFSGDIFLCYLWGICGNFFVSEKFDWIVKCWNSVRDVILDEAFKWVVLEDLFHESKWIFWFKSLCRIHSMVFRRFRFLKFFVINLIFFDFLLIFATLSASVKHFCSKFQSKFASIKFSVQMSNQKSSSPKKLIQKIS